jgi:hypothetical protein
MGRSITGKMDFQRDISKSWGQLEVKTSQDRCWKIWLSFMSTLEEVYKPLEVMGVFEGVSKLVPLWRIFKHGPHAKTL